MSNSSCDWPPVWSYRHHSLSRRNESSAPTTVGFPVVRLRDSERELVPLRWGLVPYWAKDPKIGYSTINAGAETVATAASFREAFRRRRCLAVTDGFYEWMKLDG